MKTAGLLGLAARNPLAATGALLGGASLVRGAAHAAPQVAQSRAQIEAMKHDASLPVQKIAAHAERYDRDAARHLRAKTADGMFGGQSLGASLLGTFGKSLTDGLAKTLFAGPLNKAFEIIDRKLYLEPKQKTVLHQVLQSDPVLARAMSETPEIVMGAYKTLKQYGPSLTVDPNSLRNFLRQAVVMGGQIDFATIKLLAETEKNVRQARGQIGGGS